MVSLHTNLADVPLKVSQQLSNCLVVDDLWLKIVDSNEKSIYHLSREEINSIAGSQNIGDAFIRLLSIRDVSVLEFLKRLQKLSRKFNNLFDHPQLILCRKFKELRWGHEDQIIASIIGNVIVLECTAIGFPCAEYQWYKDNEQISGECLRMLEIVRCPCSALRTYHCVASNEIAEGFSYSSMYRREGKQFKTVLESNPFDISSFVRDDERCESCKSIEYEHLREIMAESEDSAEVKMEPEVRNCDLVASDKVALLISNCAYGHLPELMTPHSDAETLATCLEEMKFKTVALADLTLEEMKFVIKEYRKLLGDGVYAVFYFVGHGFEVNGQCYLLGIDAPEDAHKPQNALSMDWVLSIFRDYEPALNVIMLDVCRKFVPFNNIPAFVQYAEQFKRYNKPFRNVVYGYSTSGGVGAYEVKGEVNGVFMKYMKEHATESLSIVEVLNRVMEDISNDPKVSDVQIPEIRSTLVKPRSLCDPLVLDGHTISFNHHTLHWRFMHELPDPVNIPFKSENMSVTIWFDFCGHFTNKVYVFSSVGVIENEEDEEHEVAEEFRRKAAQHRAYLVFSTNLHTSKERILSDDEEGVSMCWMLSNLQKNKGELSCEIQLRNEDDIDQTVAVKNTHLGHVLITRIWNL